VSPHQSFFSRPFLRGLACLLLFTQLASAHIVKQIFLSLEHPGSSWEIKATFDAGYALPEFRNDPLTPQPTREWLVHLEPAEHAELRKETEAYLRESLTFSYAGKPLSYQISFPDYQHTPPDFPKMLTGGAYLTVKITGDTPPGTSGDFTLHVHSGSRPDFVVASGPKETRQYHVIAPGKEATLFHSSASSQEVSTNSGSMFDLLKMGYTHVIPKGLDHLLFILALFLMARNWRPLLSQSLTFTLAHSITLGLAASGTIHINQWSGSWLIEPLIALSIAFVAIENVFIKKSSRHRLVVVFLFGLVHGLGFAGSLATALDQGSANSLVALALANLGVELAQVTILAVAWVLTIRWWKSKIYPTFRIAASLAIAAVGLFWMAQRLGLI
jgi:hypothetical protein